MVNNEITRILLEKIESENDDNIPFGTFRDIRGEDFNKIPNIIYETQAFKDILKRENIQIVIGPRGSGKSLLLKFQEHHLLENLFDPEYTGRKILPVWFDMGAYGFETRNSSDYENETDFHYELMNSIADAIDYTLEKIINPSFIQKFRSWRLKKKLKGPAIKEITRSKKRLSIHTPIVSTDVKGGKTIKYVKKKKFNIKELREFVLQKLNFHELDEIKIIFEEVSTLSKIVENEMNSILQEWFFDFIDIGRILNAEGLTVSIDLLPSKSTFGSHFSDSHARIIYLDYDLTTDFSDFGSQILNKRVIHYTGGKYSDYKDLFTKSAKELLDRASSGVPRTFLFLAQLCFNAKVLFKYPNINQKIVTSVLNYYAKLKERKLATNQGHLYQDLLKTISDSKQSRFIFKSDDLGNLPTTVRKFIYDMYKQEMFIKKRSFLILNQALWLGTSAVKGLNKKTKNSTISIIDYQENFFKIIGIKEVIEDKPILFEEELAKELKIDITKVGKEEGKKELIEEDNIPIKIDEEMIDITTTDDLELNTDISFPFSQIRSIMRRYWPRPKQIIKDAVIFCQDILKAITLKTIFEIDQILLKSGNISLTPEIISEIKKNNVDLQNAAQSILNEVSILDPFLKASTLGRIISDVMPYMKANRDSLISFLQYLEYWIGYYLHYSAHMVSHKKAKRMAKSDIEAVISESKVYVDYFSQK